jgi:predicted acetyltransferase
MIRLANDRDITQIIDLWNYCFDDSPEFVDFYFKTCFKSYNTVVSEEDGRIQSCLQLLPYRMMLRERETPISYIVGVATWPEYRRQGLIKKLLQFADKVMHERGIFHSILLPFQYDFYRKYGWEVCYEFLTYKAIDFSNYHVKNKPTELKSNSKFIKVGKEGNFDKLSKCYKQYMKYFNGYIMRGNKEWQKIIQDTEIAGGACYLYEEKESPSGYIIYTKNEKSLNINELVYLSNEAKAELIKLAFSHLGQVNQISRKAPFWDLDYLFMKDSRGIIEKETFVMGRIHDVVNALSGIFYSGEEFVIRVKDEFYQKNNGSFLIKQKAGNSYLIRTNQEPDCILNIRTLNQLLWGYISPELALMEGLIQLKNSNDIEKLELLFPKKYNYMTEDF